MNKIEFIQELESIFDVEPGYLTTNPEQVNSVNWDSVSTLGIIALLDSEFDIEIEVDYLKKCDGIEYLEQIIGNKFSE